MEIEKVQLQGRTVRLEPLAPHHLKELGAAIEDGELWTVPVTFVPHPRDLPSFLQDAEQAFVVGRELTFATLDQATGKVVGSTRFRCIEQVHKRVEIGFTFIAARMQRTHINTEAKYLMLRHAFETWQVNRVELLTDLLNEKSRAAIARIGAREEGTLRSHMVMRDGRVRDSVLFSIVSSEWRAVKRALEMRIDAGSQAR